ncbi:MAG: calcium/sodium antiporter [Hyphomicrobiaceae bacterium]
MRLTGGIMIAYLSLLGGFLLLVGGADVLVRGAVSVAERAGVSALLIGLTIVSWGTSAPELVVSAQAGLDGQGGIAIGNAIGSNIFNVLAVMGLVAFLKTLVAKPSTIRRDAVIAILSGIAVLLIVMRQQLEVWHGVLLLLAFVAYTVNTYLQERGAAVVEEASPGEIGAAAGRAEASMGVPLSVLLVVLGIALLVVGANLLVDGAVEIARAWGVSEAIIGLTLVAAGTSLPEAATSVVAAFRREVDVAIGNVLGSNTFNSLCIVGVTALFGPITIPGDISYLDPIIAAGGPFLILVPAVLFGRIGRFAGLAMLAGYVLYVAALAARVGLV